MLLGAPGTGKGTQAERLEQDLGLTHVASGDLFRGHAQQRTPLGLQAAAYMRGGDLVPDEVTVAMLRERLQQADARAGVVLDGFPRTLAQAEALDMMMGALARRIAGVLYLDVPDEELVTRLAGRLVCRECQAPFHLQANPFATCPYQKCQGEHLYRRDDDNPATVRARLATFHERTEPLIRYYRDRSLLVTIRGSGTLADVTAATLGAARSLASAALGPA